MKGSKTSVRYSVMDHVTGLYLVVKYTDVVSHLLHTERQDREGDKETDLALCPIFTSIPEFLREHRVHFNPTLHPTTLKPHSSNRKVYFGSIFIQIWSQMFLNVNSV